MNLRHPAASALILGALSGFAGPAQAAPPVEAVSADTQSSVAGERAFGEIAGCVSGANTLLAQVVVDESASLRSTDPAALRVPAITTAVDALEELKVSAPGRLSVEVSMSTFARRYDELVGWGELDRQHADRLRRSAAEQLPKRNSGDATDYRQAMQGAQRQLDTRAEDLPNASVCKVMLWFTDGALDVDSATTTAANELCRRQGIVDAVRRDQISVVALALFTRGGSVTDAQRDQLRAVAEGSGESTTCGTTPIASDASSGVYLSADDPAALRRLFAGATALIAGATAGPTAECPSAKCPNGKLSFDLDAGVGGFRIVADVGTDGEEPILVTPSGRRINLPVSGKHAFSVPGGSVDTFARDGLVTATMLAESLPVDPANWKVDLGRAGGGVDLYWYWGAQLVVNTPELVAGTDTQVRGSITGPDGQSLDPRLYGRLDLKAGVGRRIVPAIVNADGSFAADVVLPAGSSSTEAAVTVTATAKTRGSGVDLGPLRFSDSVPITLPPAFPALSPTSLQLADLEGLGSRTAVIDLVGSKLGPTSVCLTGSIVSGPGGGEVGSRIRGGECVALGASERSQMRVDLSPDPPIDGRRSARLNRFAP